MAAVAAVPFDQDSTLKQFKDSERLLCYAGWSGVLECGVVKILPPKKWRERSL
jgi:hypothetical protein